VKGAEAKDIKMEKVTLVFPHQLFENNPALQKGQMVFLVEEHLFFRQYNFHKRKIAFQKAGMKFYESYLKNQGLTVHYIESTDNLSDIRQLLPHLKKSGVQHVDIIDTTDNWLEKRLKSGCEAHGIGMKRFESPLFINTLPEIQHYYKDKKRFYQTDFYIHQRKQRNILLDMGGKPLGGKWSFDQENRLKYPGEKNPPRVEFPTGNPFYTEAIQYTNKNFSENYGTLDDRFQYPCTFDESRQWLQDFLKHRFHDFGPYEDAVVHKETILHHSLLSPLMNSGLLSPGYVLDKAIEYAAENNIPMNSLEGFVRQILGWREFIRAVYELKGTDERNRNFWGFTRKIPGSFWKGTTGIFPLDITIKKVLDTGYCHHIERLMVLGNFMLLCEFDPDDVYRWFMELFIDAYDWVMVPNVYGMSQFADGGLMATKPYISGSNYLMKMTDFHKGEWQQVWDGLFWRFMDRHRDFFLQNPRLGMLVKMLDKMDQTKKEVHFTTAEEFLEKMTF
jgi:deoxyribodipyrimidine photolyase-related protein